MQKRPKISEAEWLIMKTLWSRYPSTANDVVESLGETTSWKPKTIKTLINRLVNKGAVGFEKKGRLYYYRPLVSEAECVKAEARSLLGRTGGAALKPMLAAFLEEDELSPSDVSELKQILEQKGKV